MSEENPFRPPSTPIGHVAPGTSRSHLGIYGTDGLSDEELGYEIDAGGRFVVFDYCVSALVITFRRTSKCIYFVRPGRPAAISGLPYILLSLTVGWWGFPWGFIFTPMAIIQNICGGRDVTYDVVRYLGWDQNRALETYR